MTTAVVEMTQFGVDNESLFMFEVLLSPERTQYKRDTINMVQLLQAFGAFRGAMTLIGLNLVGGFSANSYKNELAKCFIDEGGSTTPKAGVNDHTARFFELFMITYFWGFGVKKQKITNLQNTQKEMTKELDMGKMFDKLDQINVNELEDKLKTGTF